MSGKSNYSTINPRAQLQVPIACHVVGQHIRASGLLFSGAEQLDQCVVQWYQSSCAKYLGVYYGVQ